MPKLPGISYQKAVRALEKAGLENIQDVIALCLSQ